MSDAVAAAVITGIFALIAAVVAAVISSKVTSDKTIQKLEKTQAVTNNEIQHFKEELSEMKCDLRAHNHYAQLFNENVPVIKERLSEGDRRMTNIEDQIKELRNNRE